MEILFPAQLVLLLLFLSLIYQNNSNGIKFFLILGEQTFPIRNPQYCSPPTCKNISISPSSSRLSIPFSRILNQMNYKTVIFENEKQYELDSSDLYSSTYF